MTDKKDTGNNILFPGIVSVSGMPDVGKTTFAIEAGPPPSRICFIDDDVKGQGMADALRRDGTPFEAYINLVNETRGMLETQFHKHVMDFVKGIEPGRFDLIIFDSFARFENSFHPWVLTHQKDFKESWSPNGMIHGAEIWKKSFDYEAEFLDTLQKKAPLVIITSHMKRENIGGRRTGKMIPDVKTPMIQKSLFRIILRRSDDGSPIPTGIILKRIARRVVTDTGIKTINVLPTKVPHLNWEKIREYYENPVGNAEPKPDEMPNEFELAMLDSSILTDDQKFVMKFALEAAAMNDEDEENEGEKTLKSQMLSMKADGVPYPDIAKAFDTDVKSVIEILKG